MLISCSAVRDVKWNNAGTISPATARNIIDIERRADLTLNFWLGYRSPPANIANPRVSSKIADDRAGERCLDDRDQAVLEGENPDDQLRRIPHRRVQKPPERRTQVGTQCLGRATDDLR